MHFCHIVVQKRRSWRGAGEGERGRRGGGGNDVEPVVVWMRNASLKSNTGLRRDAPAVSEYKRMLFLFFFSPFYASGEESLERRRPLAALFSFLLAVHHIRRHS